MPLYLIFRLKWFQNHFVFGGCAFFGYDITLCGVKLNTQPIKSRVINHAPQFLLTNAENETIAACTQSSSTRSSHDIHSIVDFAFRASTPLICSDVGRMQSLASHCYAKLFAAAATAASGVASMEQNGTATALAVFQVPNATFPKSANRSFGG